MSKNVARNKGGPIVVIKYKNHQKVITVLYALKNKTLKFIRQKLAEVYRETDKSVTLSTKLIRGVSSVSQLFATLCHPMYCCMPGFLSITNSRSLLKLIHVHQVGDAIQPSHPQSSPSPPAFSLSHGQSVKGTEDIKKHSKLQLMDTIEF